MLLRAARAAALATVVDGQPFASLVTPAASPDRSLLMLLSGLVAAHAPPPGRAALFAPADRRRDRAETRRPRPGSALRGLLRWRRTRLSRRDGWRCTRMPASTPASATSSFGAFASTPASMLAASPARIGSAWPTSAADPAAVDAIVSGRGPHHRTLQRRSSRSHGCDRGGVGRRRRRGLAHDRLRHRRLRPVPSRNRRSASPGQPRSTVPRRCGRSWSVSQAQHGIPARTLDRLLSCP